MPKTALNVVEMEGFQAGLVLVPLLAFELGLGLMLEFVFALVIAIAISYDYFPLGDWDIGNPSSWPGIAGSRGVRQSISTCLSDSWCKRF